MTFAVLPPWLAWGVLVAFVAAAIGVFLVRPRPTRLLVASLVVWSQALDVRRTRTLWERLRWFVSLLLTAAIAGAIAVALVRPAPGTGTARPPRMLVVLDSSWTMHARRTSGLTRWDEARREAARLVSGPFEVALATTGEGIVEGPTTDRPRLLSALDRLGPSGAGDETWPRLADAAAVHLITDGATRRLVPPGVTVHSVYEPADNVAVSAFEVAALGDGKARAFLAVSNHAPSARTVQVSIVQGDREIYRRAVQLGPESTLRETVEAATTAGPRFLARVLGAGDALAIDDESAAWLPEAASVSVGIVGTSGAVAALLARDPGIRVVAVSPGQYRDTSVDVWVFEHWLPDEAPASPFLVFDPPPNSGWLGAVRTGPAADTWRAQEAHPLIAGVDGAWFSTAGTTAVDRAGIRPVVVTESGVPLVSVAERPGRMVVFGFSTETSNIASTPAFPVLVANSVDWLVGRDDRGRPPGRIVLPRDTTELISPSGAVVPLTRRRDSAVAVVDHPGLYMSAANGRSRVLRVSLGETSRSNLHLSSVPVDREERPAPSGASRDWWQLAAGIALGLVLVEWRLWRSRVTV